MVWRMLKQFEQTIYSHINCCDRVEQEIMARLISEMYKNRDKLTSPGGGGRGGQRSQEVQVDSDEEPTSEASCSEHGQSIFLFKLVWEYIFK